MSLNGRGLDYGWCKLRAIALLVIGRRDAAEALFGEMLRRWPLDAYALASRAIVRAQLGRRDAAIEDARALIAAHPTRSAADWFNLAYLLEDASRLAEAEHVAHLVGDHRQPRIITEANAHKVLDEVQRIVADALLPGVRMAFATGLAAWVATVLTGLGTLEPDRL